MEYILNGIRVCADCDYVVTYCKCEEDDYYGDQQ